MDMTFHVDRVSTHPVSVMVDYQGAQAQVQLPELEVVLYHNEGVHGSLTLHFRSVADIAAAKALYLPGEEVVVNFSLGKPAPEVIDTAAAEPAAV